jgi:hypothetical protein
VGFNFHNTNQPEGMLHVSEIDSDPTDVLTYESIT